MSYWALHLYLNVGTGSGSSYSMSVSKSRKGSGGTDGIFYVVVLGRLEDFPAVN